MPWWLIKYLPAIGGVIGIAGLIAAFNLWLGARDARAVQLAEINRLQFEVENERKQRKDLYDLMIMDAKAREKEKQLEIDRSKFNEDAINQAKADPAVKHIYIEGKCESPAEALW